MVSGADFADMKGHFERARAERDRLRVENERLREALDQLDQYVGHDDVCNVRSGAPECSCGFDEMYTEILAVLRGTRDLLSDPDRWTQHTVARDEVGRDLFDMYESDGLSMHEADLKACLSPDAVCWCLGGALTRVAGHPIHAKHSQFAVLWDEIGDKVGPWNDTHTHADVLAALDKAISRASRDSEATK